MSRRRLFRFRQPCANAAPRDLVEGGSQFIVATHSPILTGYPEATIYQLSESGYEQVGYEETSHYQLTRAFLENREQFLRHLFRDHGA